ncbi:sugar phosphate isomerase/epimerase family protein [Larkinella soli]|uniref:sugar phosphate isomerase/epimerase family protein n=1 Tax=Larkinella soli TaxID=1770527 RepID=UPI000FFC9718|nr:sugar phosphate isomerase/epimerase [Larkinella soli]
MSYRILLPILLWTAFSATTVRGQRVKNEFFVLHNAIRGDSTYRTFDQQVKLIQSLGFDGVEINQIDSFEGMKAALDKYRFRGSYFYFKIRLEEPHLDPRLPGAIQALKGSGTVLAPYVVSDTKKFAPSTHDADTMVVRLLRELSDLARPAGLSIALYPHIFFYVERTDHALELVRKAARPNVGVSFNLPHWLATTPKAARAGLFDHLRTMKPYLKLVTVCGASDEDAPSTAAMWDVYIQPLGRGTFDTFGLLRFLTRDLGYKGAIGVQCYNIRGDKPELLRNTIAVWRQYRQKLDQTD